MQNIIPSKQILLLSWYIIPVIVTEDISLVSKSVGIVFVDSINDKKLIEI